MKNWNNIDFNYILNSIESNALSNSGKQLIRHLKPSSDLNVVIARLDETYEAYQLLQHKLHILFINLKI